MIMEEFRETPGTPSIFQALQKLLSTTLKETHSPYWPIHENNTNEMCTNTSLVKFFTLPYQWYRVFIKANPNLYYFYAIEEWSDSSVGIIGF